VHTVAALLLHADPHVYDHQLPPALAAQFPAWQRLLHSPVNGSQVALSTRLSLATAGGERLVGFAKSGAYNALLHDDIIGPFFGAAMAWETWRRSRDALPSVCLPAGNSTALNVAAVRVPGGAGRAAWLSVDDHAKWGVSVGGGARRVVCLGDMNRSAWQRRRGGGFVCFEHDGVWRAFHSLLAGAWGCAIPGAGVQAS
jgi:hypothetical protein